MGIVGNDNGISFTRKDERIYSVELDYVSGGISRHSFLLNNRLWPNVLLCQLYVFRIGNDFAGPKW